jgi:hypothetical protein
VLLLKFHIFSDAWYSKGLAVKVCDKLGVSMVLKKSLEGRGH